MKIIYKKEKENKMDAPCKIQGSIHKWNYFIN